MIFISYKSGDVIIARRIAEALISIDESPWFAEYQVLSKDFFPFKERNSFAFNLDVLTEDRLTSIINDGIRKAKKAICILNWSYVRSMWCYEKEFLPIKKKLSSKNVFILYLGRERIIKEGLPDLSEHPSFHWNGEFKDLFENLLICGIINSLPSAIFSSGKFHDGTTIGIEKKYPFQYDISYWQKLPKLPLEGILFQDVSPNSNSTFIRRINGKVLYTHWLFQTFKRNEYHKVIRLPDLKKMDERKIINRNINDISEYIENAKSIGYDVDILGYHLYPDILGYSHFGFTCLLKKDSFPQTNMLSRKLIINLPIFSDRNSEYEVVITTGWLDLKGNHFQKYIHCIPVFDDLIEAINRI